MTESARGVLRRDGTRWVLHLEDGRTLHSITVEEPNPTPHVGKKKWWLVANVGPHQLKIRLDRRTKAVREAVRQDGGKVRFATPHRTIRTVSGGAPGLGKSRSGES